MTTHLIFITYAIVLTCLSISFALICLFLWLFIGYNASLAASVTGVFSAMLLTILILFFNNIRLMNSRAVKFEKIIFGEGAAHGGDRAAPTAADLAKSWRVLVDIQDDSLLLEALTLVDGGGGAGHGHGHG